MCLSRFTERLGDFSGLCTERRNDEKDSCAGLLAWIIEKMWRWVDGELESCISKDELLTNISLFWFTQSITSSMRLYREAIGPQSTAMPDILKHRCVVSALPYLALILPFHTCRGSTVLCLLYKECIGAQCYRSHASHCEALLQCERLPVIAPLPPSWAITHGM